MTDFHSVPASRGLTRIATRIGGMATLGLLALAFTAAAVTAAPPSTVKAAIKKTTLVVTGTPAADVIVLRLAPADPTILEIDAGGDGSADFRFQRSRFTRIDVAGAAGNDTLRIDDTYGMFTDTEVTRLLGEDGHDTILGSIGAETISGGVGDDTLHGNRGADLVNGDAGTDNVTWVPGDGNDVVEGGTGVDRLSFTGSNAGETIDIAPAAGGRVTVTRNIALVVLDLGSTERVDLFTLGGTDGVNVGDLSATALDLVAVDLMGFGDDAAETVTVHGTAAADVVTVAGIPGGVEAQVQGGATTQVTGIELGLDHVVVNGGAGSDIVEANGTAGSDSIYAAGGTFVAIGGSPFGQYVVETVDETVRLNGLGGTDTLSAVGNLVALTSLVLDGGDGPDTLLGSNGPDVLNGGPGDDHLDGNQGADQVNGGADDDTIAWDPGDGSDVVEGGEGTDELLFRGSNVGENIQVSAAGGRALVSRNIGLISLDLGGVETATIQVRGGADTVVVDDLSTTELGLVDVDVDGGLGGGDGVTDLVYVVGTDLDDTISVSRNGSAIEAAVQGGATTRVSNMEGAFDVIHVDGMGGSDVTAFEGTDLPETMTAIPTYGPMLIDGGPFGGFRIETVDETVRLNGHGGDDTLGGINGSDAFARLVLDGGDGADILFGASAADVLLGGDGPDTLSGGFGADQVDGGLGDDLVTWDPGYGNDSIEGGEGNDRLLFRGANAAEVVDIGAPTGRLRLSRSIGNVTLDMGGVETIDVLLRAGGDIIVVNDLSATEVTDVNIDAGGFDGVEDQLIALGTANPDAITVTAVGNAVATAIPGAATTTVTGAEPTLDRLYVQGMGGDDTFDVVGPVWSLILLFLNQN